MSTPKPVFVIPTYRLRDVAETVEAYDQHFRRNGHSLDLIVFDDSSGANQQKYYPLLEQTRTHNPLYYVGPKQKEEFLHYFFGRLRDRKLEPLIRNLFRPSYGGNRNYTLMYTLGDFMVSADDDMRPMALMEDSPETLEDNEVCRGKLMRADSGGFTEKSFDILAAFLDVLGKPVRDIPANHERGELLMDTAMDLETNTSRGFARENSLLLQTGTIPDTAIVKMAQTFRSGTNDIDALDFVEMFLEDPTQVHLDDLNELYVLVNFRPAVTKQNWRMDCGVAAYDNEFGCRRSSRLGSGSRITFIGCGFSKTDWRRRTSMQPNATSKTTTCEIRWRRKFSTKKSPTSSSARSKTACRIGTN